MGEQDKADVTDTSVPNGDITHNINRFDYVSWLEREAGAQAETISPETLRGTSRMKTYPVDETNWKQRVLKWFRRD